LDTIAVLLVLWKVLTDSTSAWDTATGWLAGKLANQEGPLSDRHQRHLKRIHTICRVVCHTLVASGILYCLGVEFYYFYSIFSSTFVDFTSWSFGQIVGIMTWAAVFIEFVYLEYSMSCPLLQQSRLTFDCIWLTDTLCRWRRSGIGLAFPEMVACQGRLCAR